MSVAPLHRFLKIAAVAAPLAFGIAGCETFDKLNPFAEKQTPLPGERKPLFPEGVPGVQFGAPPQQPTNSNIPISPSIAEEQRSEQGPPPQQASRPQSAPAQEPAPQPARSAKSGTKGGDDPWTGTR